MSAPTETWVTGKAATALFGATDLAIRKSSLKAKCSAVPVTNKKSNGKQEVAPGISSWSGSITIVQDSAVPVSLAEGSYIQVTAGFTGGRSYAGWALITEVSDDGDIEGEYTTTITVESSGAYTAA